MTTSIQEDIVKIIERRVDPSGMSRSIYGSGNAAKDIIALFTSSRVEVTADEIETLVGVWRTAHASNGGNLHASMRRVLEELAALRPVPAGTSSEERADG